MPPVDLFRNVSSFQKMNEIRKLITDSSCYATLAVQAEISTPNEEERVLRVIGKYDNKINFN